MNGNNSKSYSQPFAPCALRFARRGGQVLIPSLLIIPSLLLFVYLLFETTKISREKIRQQFAVDSAAFIEMGDYTNLLNRTAYVNGAFPYRIFKEAFECPGADGTNKPLQKSDGNGEICAYDMMYAAGAFPKYKNDMKGQDPTPLDDKPKWEIEFDNTARPDFTDNPTSQKDTPLFELITGDQGTKIMVFFKTQSIGFYTFYAQVYSLLGSVEESQFTVFDRLTENFNFFRKSYYLNSNVCDPSNAQTCGDDGLHSSGGFFANKLVMGGGGANSFFMHYIQKIDFWGKQMSSTWTGVYDRVHCQTPIPMTTPDPKGLFQLATVPDSTLLKLGNGFDVYQGWDAPSNYFKVDFNVIAKCSGMKRPCVHALVATQCPQMSSGNNCVWPNPTPKYQTRLYP